MAIRTIIALPKFEITDSQQIKSEMFLFTEPLQCEKGSRMLLNKNLRISMKPNSVYQAQRYARHSLKISMKLLIFSKLDTPSVIIFTKFAL